MNRLQLEKKYGITIADDTFYSPRRSKFVKAYKIFSADGCPWENGLSTLKAIEKECEQWEDALLDIKKSVTLRKVV